MPKIGGFTGSPKRESATEISIAILNDYTRYQAEPGNADSEALPPFSQARLFKSDIGCQAEPRNQLKRESATEISIPNTQQKIIRVEINGITKPFDVRANLNLFSFFLSLP